MNPSTALARVLVDELARCGLTEAVVAPGSRSTPLAMALAAHPDVRVHVRIDERSASFLALGLARAERRPAALVCTSGTAAANFHPAVLEADQSGVPLLILTADRPPELRDTGANQTVDQIDLYGSAVRMFTEVGTPEAVPGMVAYWRSLACRAWGAAVAERPGAVHLNLAFREPLVPEEPAPGTPADSGWPEPLAGRAQGRPWITAGAPPVEPPTVELPPVERGVIICGDGDYDPIPFLGLAAATGWPLLAEPTSNARRAEAVSTYRHLLASPDFAAAHEPELIVSVGRPGLSRQLMAYLKRARRHVVVGPARGFADPQRTATDVVPAVAPPAGADPDTPWARSWRRAEARARAALDAVLDGEDALSEVRLARDLAAQLPNGSLLFAGSSMPIRDLDAAMSARCGARIIGNRGVSGIDGTVSTAVGAALAHQRAGGGGAYALLGDLALLHDQNGLVIGPGEPRPELCVVVVNNDGGGIFSGLEQAGHPDFERLFGTPHGVSMERVAAMAELPYTRLECATDLPKALLGEGLRLVEVRTGRGDSAALRRRLQQAVDTALAA
ncbi:2-succinyl-5-enolpyruvyl-6-hydroxy-3-cyclohexene-1-carboxylic-acid synthase [Streptomonospora nanhaiensis]|uniref:2-succinyl-5-enolpyruvyl-6-hydroxy-3-cyclohexene-1-carboxylate synthase n=1 Tax=Streptomonospora nanhaiensis TaxID=1323731 RepID=A0A853BG50_9ACTN|nr:2-succinyl-5-enolpyruvyl-6-hydroxy-3-cyclohexene-1-carboxylic-acid synthase [Streptomonospora nanhaiensis]MBV2364373.1 2-succinyl-5-enolpyruvyl-6-hydroxy-3-cyclohexene-1-carboxylic-acid synthase [Streptomonospora nanhaiensis]MBX9390488.1 2-succinyl-5-enolpyruvyl-6-hydroxy-3-cyclohexene-1-carboxylic-acid synthase [Streptomonospora nanhaiensis]NYI94000.1 2-succinyl-5-enolpyruvyl-6-hydroxy-3-cyclohexene-1-carboxylate synthase [Streptomonospora nanhaiensis]